MVQQETVTEIGWFESIKERFNTMMQKLRLSKETLLEIALYGGIGFLSGFLLKKYSWYVFVFVLLIIGLILLNRYELISTVVHWNKIYQFFGIQAATVTEGGILVVVWDWIKINIVISLSFAIGFILGLKFG